MKKRMSQREIAARVGISQPAVSTFLENPNTSTVSREKKEKLFEIIRKNNLRFHSGKSAGVGFVIPSRSREDEDSPWRFYHHFYTGVVESCRKKERKLIIYDDISDLKTFLDHSSLEVNGLVMLQKVNTGQAKMIMDYHPLVLMNQETEELVCDTVMPDNKGGIGASVSHLVENGHEKIGFYGVIGPGRVYYKNIHFHKRLDGFYEAMRKHNLPADGGRVKVYEAREQTHDEMNEFSIRAVESWTESGDIPTAVVCPGDYYALGLMKAAAGAGLSVPGDLSVTGFNNNSACDFSSPGLTSVACRMHEIAEACVELLERRLQGDKSSPKKVVCGVELVKRESVKQIL